MKRILSLLMAVLLLCSLAVTASAEDGEVIYNGNAGEFVFESGSDRYLTDLFPDFKDVMPGDTLEQRIVIRNEADRQVKVKIYLRALGAHEESKEFLSQLGLRVEQVGAGELFDSTADQTAQLTDWICLGTLYSGGEIELNVVLEVPITLGNDFQSRTGHFLDWEFKVEEFPVEEDDPKPPAQTGDESNLYLYMGIMAASGLILILLFLLGKKKKEQEEEPR